MAKQQDVLANVNINLNDIPNVECDKCHNKTFKPVFIIKKISALVSPNGKETIVPIQVYSCDSCGKISSLFKNLNDTDEMPNDDGESIQASITKETDEPQKIKSELFLG